MKRRTYNFLRGIGSVLDVMPRPEPSCVGEGINLNQTDAEALRKDWNQVACDFRQAFEVTTREAQQHVKSKQAEA